MINNLILVGRLATEPTIKQISDNVKVCNILLAVNRPFKDLNTGEYGVDFIPISRWNGISKVANDFCSKGDTVGIKGRVVTKIKEENGVKKYSLEVIGENITFIHLNNPKDGLKMMDEDCDLEDIALDEEKWWLISLSHDDVNPLAKLRSNINNKKGSS